MDGDIDRPHPDSGSADGDAEPSAPGSPVCTPGWLALREDADAAARAGELIDLVGPSLAPDRPVVIRDLGAGTGSMGRWLAGRLPGPQRWILHDRDPRLLDLAREYAPTTAVDGAPITTRTVAGDITDLGAADLAGTSLVTASALLDLLTREEVDRLVAACVRAGCPALLTLSVVGRVELTPSDPLDDAFATAFNAHQRRCAAGRYLLGPDAGTVAAEAFRARGAAVYTRPSPWRLGPEHAELARQWLRGWVEAACEQRPGLRRHADGYLDRRLGDQSAARLQVVVDHVDLLALPPGAPARHRH